MLIWLSSTLDIYEHNIQSCGGDFSMRSELGMRSRLDQLFNFLSGEFQA